MKIGIVAGVIVLVIALIVCLVPLKEVAYTLAVDYEDIETYYEDEPYEDTETYCEPVPLSYDETSYVKEDTIKERHRIIIGGIVFQDEVVEIPIQVASVDVRNTDDIAGSFTVSFYGITPLFGSPSLNKKLDLSPGEVKTATCPTETLGTWHYDVIPSTKTVEKERIVTKYRQVEKQRTITAYRQVEKERTVWKKRLETGYKKVTVLDYLLHY